MSTFMKAYQAHTSIVEWTRADAFHKSFLIPEDKILNAAVKHASDNGLPVEIALSPAQAKFMGLLVKSLGAKRVLELGTLGGYSAIWMGREIPEDGEFITLELDEKHAKIARENIANAGLTSKCRIIVGPAYDSMINLPADVPFDLIFMDADTTDLVKYFTEAKRLLRKNGVIVIDNVVQFGLVSDLSTTESWSIGVRALLEVLKDDKEVEATTIGTVGERGWDGFLYAVKL